MSLLTVNERNYWVWLEIRKQAKQLKEQGYVTKLNKLVAARIRVDLYAEKGGRKVAYVYRTNRDSEEDVSRIQRIHKILNNEAGIDLHLMWVSVPSAIVELYVEELEIKLMIYIGEHLGDLDQLSSHTIVDSVEDIEYEIINVEKKEIRVTGAAIVNVELQYGSGSDVSNGEGATGSDSFPFTFDLTLDHDLEILRVEDLAIDTSSFYK